MVNQDYKTTKYLLAVLILFAVLITGCSTTNKFSKEGTGVKFTDGDEAQILVLFDYDNGTPVLAADNNYAYYDDGGAAAVSEVIDLSRFNDEMQNFTIYIPVSALKIDKNKAGNILVTPVLFIDDFDASSGKQFAFKIAG